MLSDAARVLWLSGLVTADVVTLNRPSLFHTGSDRVFIVCYFSGKFAPLDRAIRFTDLFVLTQRIPL